MKHYLFFDREECEDFLVDAENLDKAKEIAEENYPEPCYVREYTDEQAEASGLIPLAE